MRKLFVLLTLLTVVLSSCTYDYDINQNLGNEFAPKVVLNSVINPDSLIKGTLFWTRHVNDESSDFKTVDVFDLKLYEDDRLIFDDQFVNGEFKTNIYPKAGSSYSIELNIPQYGEVKASTNIPTTSTFTGSYDGVKGASFVTYMFYTIDNIITSQQIRALWVKDVLLKYDDGTYGIATNLSGEQGLFLNNPFCDQINSYSDPYDVALKGSEMGHRHFIRIPYKNIAQALPLKFSIRSYVESDRWDAPIIGEDEWGDPIYGDSTFVPAPKLVLTLITPSDDYDMYYKSVYKQGYFTGDIFSEAVNVYSNVENGVGIFAGYIIEKHQVTTAAVKTKTIE